MAVTDTEIWEGVPSGGTVGKTVTVTVNTGSNDGGEVADIVEFSHVTAIADKTATSDAESTVYPLTGTTATTTSANEYLA